jgi:phenylpropionate dioxygenase-like ring-hydroxylating dioxygenase large terminal subunit
MSQPSPVARLPVGRATDGALTREHYTSHEIFEREREKIFASQWTFAGHLSQVPKVGDYFLHRYAGESLIIVRESATQLRAHYNVCRHRGSRIADAPAGNVRNFICPYHQWNYALDGSLRRAPMMPDVDCIDYDKHALFPASVEVWAGLIFVNLSPTPEVSLTAALGEPSEGLKKMRPQHMKEIHRETLSVRANWKTLLENYLECYHCMGSHPELGIAFDIQSSYVQTAGWGPTTCFLGGEPLRKGLMTVSMTGDLVAKPLGDYAKMSELPAEVTEGMGCLPVLSRALFHIDHAIIHAMNPISPDEVDWTTCWYVNADAVEGVDYDKAKVTEVWRTTNAEDKVLCERNYLGVTSRMYRPGPLHPAAEGALGPALRFIQEMMER